MARFLADECFSGRYFRALREAGIDISRSADIAPGAPDEQVLAMAFDQGRVLVTEDNDFGDLTVRLGLPTHGVVRVDLKSLDKLSQITRLLKAFNELADGRAHMALVTVEPTRTRVRRLDQTPNAL
jgi:predicted nuclease of predicted toxin-antitoxin system